MTIAIAGAELRGILRAVSFAAMPKCETRHALRGVRLRAFDGRLHVAATDGHRLARTSRPVEGDGFPTMTLHIAELPALYHACRVPGCVALSPAAPSRGFTGGLQLDGGRTGASTRFGGTGRDDEYPDYEKVIPTTWPLGIALDPMRTTRTLAQLAGGWFYQTPHLIRLRRGETGHLEAAPFQGPGGTLARLTTVPLCWPSGAWEDRVVNAVYLLDAVAAAPSNPLVLRMTHDPMGPIGLFTPDDPAWICVTMPVRDGDGPSASHGTRTLH